MNWLFRWFGGGRLIIRMAGRRVAVLAGLMRRAAVIPAKRVALHASMRRSCAVLPRRVAVLTHYRRTAQVLTP